MQVEMSTRSTNRSFKKLITERDDVSPEDIYQALCKQEVELVFTAHPTQVCKLTLLRHLRMELATALVDILQLLHTRPVLSTGLSEQDHCHHPMLCVCC